jgi:hypothetical protein
VGISFLARIARKGEEVGKESPDGKREKDPPAVVADLGEKNVELPLAKAQLGTSRASGEEEEEEDEEVRRGVYGRSYKVPASVVRGAFLETAILIKHRYAVRDSAYSLEREARGH